MKNTNTNEIKGLVYKYLLDALAANDGNEGKAPHELIAFMAEEFDRVANYPFNLQRFPNKQNRFADWLQGLPFGIDFMNYRILEIAKEWHGVESFSEREENKIIENWFSFLAFFCLKMIDSPEKVTKLIK